MAPPPSDPVVGIVGKLPAHGDFVRRGGPAAVLTRVDRWLDAELGGAVAQGIAPDEAVAALHGWRFAFATPEGAAIAAVVASRDAVGREFPLVALRIAAAGCDRDAAEEWCAAAADALATARDARMGVDAALAALATIDPPVTCEDDLHLGWWHPDPVATAGEDASLPTGDAFVSLLSRVQA